jgi:transposase-like protein
MVHLIVFVVEVSIRDQCLFTDLFQKKTNGTIHCIVSNVSVGREPLMIFFPKKRKSVTYHYIKIEQYENKHSRQCFKSPAKAFS